MLTEYQRKGLLYLIPLGLIVAGAIFFGSQRRSNPDFEALVDLLSDMPQEERREYPDRPVESEEVIRQRLFRFDPNTIDLRGLMELGFSQRDAAGILNYRDAGKIFRTPADFATCYQVSLAMYERLEPYITIAERFRFQSNNVAAITDDTDLSPRRDSLFLFDPNTLNAEGFRLLGFSVRQADAIISYREMIGGFRSIAEFSECYQVSPEMLERLRPYIEIAPRETVREITLIDVNSADSALLCTVSGIGSVTAGRIVAYRQRLGGFHSIDQLAEVQGVLERNFLNFRQQIFADISKIKKININFATPQELSDHPYIEATLLRRILRNRQLNGNWSTVDEMVKDDTLTATQAEKLGPYLWFDTTEN